MSDDDHDIDVEEDTGLEIVDGEDHEVSEDADRPDPAPPENRYDDREDAAREQENVDNRRDEERFEPFSWPHTSAYRERNASRSSGS